jgi:hypothetical protein
VYDLLTSQAAGWFPTLFAPNNTYLTVPNYSFETPTTSTYVYDPTGASWTFSGHAGISANGSGFTSGNPAAPNGSQGGMTSLHSR